MYSSSISLSFFPPFNILHLYMYIDFHDFNTEFVECTTVNVLVKLSKFDVF